MIECRATFVEERVKIIELRGDQNIRNIIYLHIY